MPETPLRIALVGAGTLTGKALNDELASSTFAAADIRLMDEDEALGSLTASGDEVTFIQGIEPDSFDGCDFTFFAGSRELTRKHWQRALDAGSRIVDLSGEMEGAAGVPICAPWIQDGFSQRFSAGMAPAKRAHGGRAAVLDLQTRAVVAAHPAAVLLALLAMRSARVAPLHAFWATLMQPASEHGHAALEELHRQTANLLSFQPLPTEVFGGQAAFTLAISFGEEGRAHLDTTGAAILRHFAAIAPALHPLPGLQVVQVPIFHGYGLSVAVEFDKPTTVDALRNALTGSPIRIVREASDFPGNADAIAEDDMQVLVRPVAGATKAQDAPKTGSQAPAGQPEEAVRRFWIWAIADNLKFATKNAIACATELDRLRPRGSVQ